MKSDKGSMLGRLDDAVYAVEKAVVSLFFAVMTLVVFFDVAHRIFVVPESKLGSLWMRFGIDASTAHGVLGPATLAGLTLLVVYAALRERWGEGASKKKAGAYAVVSVAVLAVALELFLGAFPNGLIWSQTLGLSLMLWVGLIGASMAAKQRRHLALEIGSKIWPQSMKRPVRIFAGVLVAVFCAFLAYLAFLLIQAEFRDFDPEYGTGMYTGLPLPKFLVYAILPYGFFMIVIRYLRGNLTAGDLSEAEHILSHAKQEEDDA